MAIEHRVNSGPQTWREVMFSKPSSQDTPTFFRTEPSDIPEIEGATVRYIIAEDGDNHGLSPGLYAETNINADFLMDDTEFRRVVRHHILFELNKLKKERAEDPSSLDADDLQLGVNEAINFSIGFITSNGAAVFRLEPVTPLQVEQKLRDLSDGKITGGITLNN